MIRLLKIEFNKILYSKTFWVIFGLYVVLFALFSFGLDSILNSITFDVGANDSPVPIDLGVFTHPSIWLNLAYLASWFKLLLVVIIVILVTNEYRYKTLRQNIIDGMSKWEIILAKELVILILSLFAVLLLACFTLILGDAKEGTNIFDGSGILLAYFFSLILYLNFAYLLSTWLRRSGFVMGILFLYTLIIENVICFKIPDHIADYFPINLIDNMIPNPIGKVLGKDIISSFAAPQIGAAILYIALFIFLNYWMLKRGNAGKA